MSKLACVVVVACITVASAVRAAPSEDRRDIGGLSFVLPAGWKLEEPPAGADHVRLTFLDAKRYCIVSLYQARAAGPSLDADFASEWTSVGGSVASQSPKPARRSVGGRAVIEASAVSSVADGSLLERIGVLDGGAQVTTMVTITASAATQRACQSDADSIYTSLRFPASAGAAPAPGPAATPAPAPAAAAPNGLVGTVQTSITLANLAGTWTDGAASLTSYVNSSTGDFAGSSTSFVGMKWVFAADGTYKYSESGMSNNHIFRNTDSGKVSLGTGTIVLTRKDGHVDTYQLLAYVTRPAGDAVLTLWPIYPTSAALTTEQIASQCYIKAGIFQCRYGSVWSRAAPTKTK